MAWIMGTMSAKFLPIIRTQLQRFGRPATFSQSSAYAYNPATGIGTPTVATSVTTQVTPPDKYEGYFVDGDLILATDLRIYVECKNLDGTSKFTVEPKAGDTVTISGTVYSIISVGHIDADDITIMYEVQLRK